MDSHYRLWYLKKHSTKIADVIDISNLLIQGEQMEFEPEINTSYLFRPNEAYRCVIHNLRVAQFRKLKI